MAALDRYLLTVPVETERGSDRIFHGGTHFRQFQRIPVPLQDHGDIVCRS